MMICTSTSERCQSQPSQKPVFSRGFTLTEVLTVIAVLGILLGVIVPVVQSSFEQATSITEMAAAKRLGEGYIRYSTDHEGRLISGYLSQDPGDQDHEDLYTVHGPDGTLLQGREKRRWPWRLLPYLDNSVDSIFINQGRDYIDTFRGTDDYEYIASVYPSFGLNAEWLGGMKGATYSDLHDLGKFTGTCYYSQRLSDIRRPSEQLVFASSRGPELDGNGNIEGYFYLLSPWYHTTGWRWNETDSGEPLHQASSEPSKNGFISTRNRDKTATVMVDGHTALDSLQTLSDMRRWSNMARSSNWVLDFSNP